MKKKPVELAKKAKESIDELNAVLGDFTINEKGKKDAKASTKATAKYQERVGLAAKTYKIKAQIADDFKAACEAAGESQAEVLTRMMIIYVNDCKAFEKPDEDKIITWWGKEWIVCPI